jgi:hypothetical protein
MKKFEVMDHDREWHEIHEQSRCTVAFRTKETQCALVWTSIFRYPLADFAHLTGFLFDSLEVQIYCCRTNHVAAGKLIPVLHSNTMVTEP